MAYRRPAARITRSVLGALILVGAASPVAAATCAEVNQLLAQGLSVGQVAGALGAPVAGVQACLQPRGAVGNPAGPAPFGAAGPPPLGAPGPPPLGAAGPAPHNAAGPPPLGAAGRSSTTTR